MVATQESINSRFCSVVEIKLSFFLKGGHLPRSGSICKYAIQIQCLFLSNYVNVGVLRLL